MNQQYSNQWRKLALVKMISVFATFFLLLLTACTFQIIPLPDDGQSSGNGIAQGVALDGAFDGFSKPRYLYPVDVVTTTEKLTEQAITNLAKVYSGTVQLEFALVYVGNIKWDLYHIAPSLPFTQAKLWQEYMVLPNDSTTTENSPAFIQRTQWWSGYVISGTHPLSLSTSSPALTLPMWIQQIQAQSGISPEFITKLSFSIQKDGKTIHVLYLSGLQANGSQLPPDDENTCRSDREGSYYCTFIRWWNG